MTPSLSLSESSRIQTPLSRTAQVEFPGGSQFTKPSSTSCTPRGRTRATSRLSTGPTGLTPVGRITERLCIMSGPLAMPGCAEARASCSDTRTAWANIIRYSLAGMLGARCRTRAGNKMMNIPSPSLKGPSASSTLWHNTRRRFRLVDQILFDCSRAKSTHATLRVRRSLQGPLVRPGRKPPAKYAGSSAGMPSISIEYFHDFTHRGMDAVVYFELRLFHDRNIAFP